MANLKEQIFTALKSEQKLTELTKDIERAKENLLKNHSNPVFNISDKNKILKAYMELDDINRDIGRFDRLRQYKYTTEALQERKSIEDILKGGMYNYNYIWKSENSSNTCEVCRALNGREFDFYDEVPQRPHPNCKCKVGILEGNVVKTPMYTSIRYQIAAPHNPFDAESKKDQWIMPCEGKIVGEYGEPRSTHTHNGIDIAVPIGTPIKAIADGKVIHNGPATGYGIWVVLEHSLSDGTIVTSEYGHLSSFNVNIGQYVKQGQEIAKSGNTGYSQGPHLHITIRIGRYRGKAVNPWNYIKD